MMKKFYPVTCYDVIMKLSEFSKLSEDYIAEMWVKLGLWRSITLSAWHCTPFFVVESENALSEIFWAHSSSAHLLEWCTTFCLTENEKRLGHFFQLQQTAKAVVSCSRSFPIRAHSKAENIWLYTVFFTIMNTQNKGTF